LSKEALFNVIGITKKFIITMFHFTKEERRIIFALTAILIAGSSLRYVFKKYPHLKDIVNLIESDRIYKKIDVNKATLEELKSVPYIGEYTARNIIAQREKNGIFYSLEELKRVKGIHDKNYKKFCVFLKISTAYPNGHR